MATDSDDQTQPQTQTVDPDLESVDEPEADFESEPETVAGIALAPGEEVLHDVRPSWWHWPWATILGIITLPLVGLGLVFLYKPWKKRKSTRYIITTDRTIQKTGITNKSSTEFRHVDLREISTSSNWWERRKGYGTITLDTHAEGKLELMAVPNHDQVVNDIRTRQVNG